MDSRKRRRERERKREGERGSVEVSDAAGSRESAGSEKSSGREDPEIALGDTTRGVCVCVASVERKEVTEMRGD